MEVQYNAGGIRGLCVIAPDVYEDNRGYFMQTFSKDMFAEEFVQENQSFSVKGVMRGLHFQKAHPQAKLVRVVQGKVYDVAVDIREDSATYGQWFGIELSDENQLEFYIPEGFAHGFYVLSDTATFVYLCAEYYYPEDQHGYAWDSVGIDWPIDKEVPLILSEKDKQWPAFRREHEHIC